MHLLGFIFIFSTTMVMVFKKEEPEEEKHGSEGEEHKNLSILDTYKLMWKLLYISPIRQLALILITIKVESSLDNPSSVEFLCNYFSRL